MNRSINHGRILEKIGIRVSLTFYQFLENVDLSNGQNYQFVKKFKIEFCQFLKKMLGLTMDKISNFGKSSASSLIDFLSIFEKHI